MLARTCATREPTDVPSGRSHVLAAAAVTDQSDDGDSQKFGAAQARSYVALTSVRHMISRGLAKAGTKGRERHSGDDR